MSTTLHAVLLAAGVGRRLAAVTGGGPKCLLPFAGESLLARHLRLLAGAGVSRLTIVTGCEPMQIGQALGELAPALAGDMRVVTTHNPDFRAGSALSVVAAAAALTGSDDVLLMDADVLYDSRLLAELTGASGRDVVTADRSVAADDAEAVKLALKNERAVAMAKTLPAELDYDVAGETCGFFRLRAASAAALLDACRAVPDADAAYEPALEGVIQAATTPFAVADITGLPWIEIDYPADVERAANAIAPALID